MPNYSGAVTDILLGEEGIPWSGPTLCERWTYQVWTTVAIDCRRCVVVSCLCCRSSTIPCLGLIYAITQNALEFFFSYVEVDEVLLPNSDLTTSTWLSLLNNLKLFIVEIKCCILGISQWNHKPCTVQQMCGFVCFVVVYLVCVLWPTHGLIIQWPCCLSP